MLVKNKSLYAHRHDFCIMGSNFTHLNWKRLVTFWNGLWAHQEYLFLKQTWTKLVEPSIYLCTVDKPWIYFIQRLMLK